MPLPAYTADWCTTCHVARSPYPSSHRRQSFLHVVSIDELVHQMNSGWLLLNGKELDDIRVSETRTNCYLGHNQAQHVSLSVLRYFDFMRCCPMSSWRSSERSLSQCMCRIDVQLLHAGTNSCVAALCRLGTVPNAPCPNVCAVSMFNSSTLGLIRALLPNVVLAQFRTLLVPMYVPYRCSTPPPEPPIGPTETQGLSIWSTLAGAWAAWSCAGWSLLGSYASGLGAEIPVASVTLYFTLILISVVLTLWSGFRCKNKAVSIQFTRPKKSSAFLKIGGNCYANDWDRVWYFRNISELNNALVNTRFLYHQETCSWVTPFQLFLVEPHIRGIFSGMLISRYDTYQHSGVSYPQISQGWLTITPGTQFPTKHRSVKTIRFWHKPYFCKQFIGQITEFSPWQFIIQLSFQYNCKMVHYDLLFL